MQALSRLLIMLTGSVATAAVADTRASAAMTGFTFGYLAKLALALVLVLAFFVVFAWAMRRYQHFGRSSSNGLSVVASLSLGTRERLIVVQAGEQQVLLGMTPTSIQQLMILEQPLATESVVKPELTTNFQQILKRERRPV